MTGVSSFLWWTFSLVCGQNPAHTWEIEGSLLPVCQRCAGLYAGAALCLLLHGLLRPNLGGRFIAAHGLLLVVAAPFGLHWIPEGPALRAMTGALAGFGIGTFLWVAPANAWDRLRGQARHPMLRPPVHNASSTGGSLRYAAGLAAALGLIPLAGCHGGVAGGWVLQGLALAGLLALTLLLAANTFLALLGLMRR
ncbi:MAG TPA: DUF2085 domain-containing protein [Candidatus Paceibacterota bacterium]|nr:DUF2085 domain-containing protein [Candidatus Paceibacterota bacterium]HRT59057.1 DUF2085 domain-containing protein [Candidatus Paceibacterota bacterium]